MTPSFETNLLAFGPSRNLRGFWSAVTRIFPDYGTGMGLRISRSIVEARGGRLSAADNGTSFYVILPTSVETVE